MTSVFPFWCKNRRFSFLIFLLSVKMTFSSVYLLIPSSFSIRLAILETSEREGRAPRETDPSVDFVTITLGGLIHRGRLFDRIQAPQDRECDCDAPTVR